MSLMRWVLVAAVLPALATACADAERSGATGPVEVSAAQDSTFDWGNPFPEGELVSNANLLADNGLTVSFVPRIPAGLAPTLVKQAPESYPPDHRQLAMSFVTSNGSPFVIFEYPTDEGAAFAELESIASQQPGCETSSPDPDLGGSTVTCAYGSGRWVTLEDGTRALVFDGTSARGVFIVVPLAPEEVKSAEFPTRIDEPALQIEIQGPISGVSADELIAVANSLKPVK